MEVLGGVDQGLQVVVKDKQYSVRSEIITMVPFISHFFLMPIIGYGTWQSRGDDLSKGVDSALKYGYRHLDCAAAYQNEHIIGDVLHQWLSSGKIKREDLFIVSKLPPAGMRPQDVQKYLTKTLADLKLDYVDLYLVHTPFGFAGGHELHPKNTDGTIMLDTSTDHIAVWKEMEKAVKSGQTKSIGLSNFNETQIQKILDISEIKPINLQIEMHLYFQQNKLRKYCSDNNITVTAYSPLGSRGSKTLFTSLGSKKEFPDLFNQPAVVELAQKYNKTSAQILLKHLIQKGVAVIPKSTSEEHIRENIDILDFQLNPEEMDRLNSLDQEERGRVLDFKIFKGLLKHPEYPFKH